MCAYSIYYDPVSQHWDDASGSWLCDQKTFIPITVADIFF